MKIRSSVAPWNRSLLIAAALGLVCGGAAGASTGSKAGCTPAYVVLDAPVKILTGASELSFELLAVGCKEALASAWPPKMDKLVKELTAELQEPHPVLILFWIRDGSPDLRKRVTCRLNRVLGKPVVQDVFLFEAKAAE